MSDNPYRPSSTNPDDLRALGQPLVEALMAYRQEQGRFPASLAAAGLAPANTPAGIFEYRASEDGRRASIFIGDFARRSFQARWSSEIGWFLESS